MACQWCDFSGYADAGGRAHKMLSAKLTPEPSEDDEADPKPAPKPAAKPAAKDDPAPAPVPTPPPPKRAPGSPFDLSQLMGGAA